MNGITCTFSNGKTKIDYDLLLMNRKSLEIAVYPDKSVVVKAPSNSTLESVEGKIKKRSRWINRQISYFNQFDPRTPERKYVGGESHLYLGRKYRLKIELSYRDEVLLKNGFFYIETISKQSEHIKHLMEAWYNRRAKMYLSKIFYECWEDFNKGNLNMPNLKVKKMEKRWGSLSAKGQLTLNTNLIQTPKECIEYVVIHELCHLIHHDHGTEYYKLLDRALPDWMKRKHKLEMALI